MRDMVGWYAPDGTPIDVQTANTLLGDIGAKTLRKTKLVTERGTIEVSTVFLVLDHRLFGEGPPVLWETLVFASPVDQHLRRYTSREDALIGHMEAVAFVRTALIADSVAVLADETASGRA